MPFAVQVVAFDPQGKRRAATGELTLTRRQYDCGYGKSGSGDADDWGCQRKDDPKPAVRRTIGVPASGTAAVERVVLAEPGEYVVEVSARHGRGGRSVASDMVYVVGKGEAFWSGDEGERMTLIASKPRYRPGRHRPAGAADAAGAGAGAGQPGARRRAQLPAAADGQPAARRSRSRSTASWRPTCSPAWCWCAGAAARAIAGGRGSRWAWSTWRWTPPSGACRCRSRPSGRRTARARPVRATLKVSQRGDAGAGRAGGGRGRRGGAADPRLPHARSAARVLRALGPGGGQRHHLEPPAAGQGSLEGRREDERRKAATAAATRRGGCDRGSWPRRSGTRRWSPGPTAPPRSASRRPTT